MDNSDKSDKSEDKSDETGTNDTENVNTSKETVSKPATQPSMTLPMHRSQQSLVGLQSYQNMMPGMQPQMMSPYGIQPLAAGDSSGMMQINVGDFQALMNFVQ